MMAQLGHARRLVSVWHIGTVIAVRCQAQPTGIPVTAWHSMTQLFCLFPAKWDVGMPSGYVNSMS